MKPVKTPRRALPASSYRLGLLLAAGALLVTSCGGDGSDPAGADKPEDGASASASAGSGGDGGTEGGADGGSAGKDEGPDDGGTGGDGSGDSGGDSGSGDSGGGGDDATDPDCPEPGVRVMPGPVDGDAELRLVRLMLLNCGTSEVTLNGYPEVRVTDAEGEAVKVSVRDGVGAVADVPGYGGGPKRLTLRPGQTAESVAVWRPGGSGGRALSVAPSDGDPRQTVRPAGKLDVGSGAELAVSPWKSVG